VLEATPDGWAVKGPSGVVLGTFPTREYAGIPRHLKV
jgi:hypothetical protein